MIFIPSSNFVGAFVCSANSAFGQSKVDSKRKVLASHSALESREVFTHHARPHDHCSTCVAGDSPDLIDEQHP